MGGNADKHLPPNACDLHCLTRNLTLRASRNIRSADHCCVFNQPTTARIPPRQKDRKPLECVERVRFLVRQPGDSLSSRQGCVAQDIAKGGEHGRRIETANQARNTKAA